MKNQPYNHLTAWRTSQFVPKTMVVTRLVVSAFFLLNFWSLTSCSAPESTEAVALPVANSPDLSRITTGPVQTKLVSQDIVCTGEIAVPPTDLISVHSRFSGQVSDLKYLPGDYVRKGAQLLRISNPEIIDKQRKLLEYRAQLATAHQALERQQTLAAGEATTAEQLSISEGAVALLSASYAGLKKELEVYGINVTALEEEGNFQSSVGVYAAGSGFVHAVTTNRGQMISPTDELLQLASTDHLHLELSVPSRSVAGLREGQTVTFTTPFNGMTGTAKVEKINPMVDANTATLNVHCHFETKLTEGLVPGLFLNAIIHAGEQELRGLPLSGTTREGEQYYGYRQVAGEWQKTLLPKAVLLDDFVTFDPGNDAKVQWVTGGAYYLEE
jgi:cobalt-zinc-cadmium efflux system membrane fusion protein